MINKKEKKIFKSLSILKFEKMSEQLIIDLSLILGIATVVAILARVIKQPPLIAYLVAGIIAGPIFLNIISQSSSSAEIINIFAKMGIALLLFIVGLSLDFRILKEFGKVSIFTGVMSILATGIIGLFIALGMGFEFMPALYLAVALCFSSAVVVVKILSDKKELDTLHGRIALGILIVESFIAAIMLMLLPVIQTGEISSVFLGIGKMILLSIVSIVFYLLIIKHTINYLARNQEILFLSGISYALALAALFSYFGLSMEIGALIAGISIASSKYAIEISGKIRPLRDFFVIILFIYFGSQLITPISSKIIIQAIIFSAALLVVKPLVIMGTMRILGYKKRTNFFTGASLAQMSEFSLIVILMGFSFGVINYDVMNLAVLISLITIAVSSYSIYYSTNIFNKISKMLNLFDGNTRSNKFESKEFGDYEVILFGCHRMGSKILENLNKMKARVLVIDYNPKSIIELSNNKVDCMYGDASDNEFLSDLNLRKAKLVISTIPDEGSNLMIKRVLEGAKSKAVFIGTAEQEYTAIDLYKQGTDYVILPHTLGGEFMAHIINSYKKDYSKYKKLGKKHKSDLIKKIRKSLI